MYRTIFIYSQQNIKCTILPMHVYYLNKHLMCEHYRNNSPTGFRVLKEQKGVTTHTDPSRTAMIFLLEGCMHVEGKQFPSFTVQTNQMCLILK